MKRTLRSNSGNAIHNDASKKQKKRKQKKQTACGNFGDWIPTFHRELKDCVNRVDPNTTDWIKEFARESPVSAECVDRWERVPGSLASFALVLTRIMRAVCHRDAQIAVANDSSLRICSDCMLGMTAITVTHVVADQTPDSANRSEVSTTTIHTNDGKWRCRGEYWDDWEDQINMPSPTDTKTWMTTQGILPLKLSTNSQPSDNPYYTYSVYIVADRTVIQERVYLESVTTLLPCIADIVSSYF
jgi:hypothetical protein